DSRHLSPGAQAAVVHQRRAVDHHVHLGEADAEVLDPRHVVGTTAVASGDKDHQTAVGRTWRRARGPRPPPGMIARRCELRFVFPLPSVFLFFF
ncbi:hypothetical protein GBAR_LOCUS26994, partial [Geodia barretti]